MFQVCFRFHVRVRFRVSILFSISCSSHLHYVFVFPFSVFDLFPKPLTPKTYKKMPAGLPFGTLNVHNLTENAENGVSEPH